MALFTPDDVRAQLPKVGDRLIRQPMYYHGFYSRHDDVKPKPCTVVYVHREHLWYTVQYDSGIRESYKMPDVRVDANGRLLD